MAEPVRSEDFPTYDTYPGRESPRSAEPGVDYLPTTWQQGAGAAGAGRESRLEETAEQIGSTLGRAVRAVRDLPEQVDQARVSMRDRLTVIRGGGGQRSAAAEKASEIKDAAQQKLEEAKDRAAQMTRQARARAQRIADERPLHVVAGAFLAAFIIGAVLRLWRSE